MTKEINKIWNNAIKEKDIKKELENYILDQEIKEIKEEEELIFNDECIKMLDKIFVNKELKEGLK